MPGSLSPDTVEPAEYDTEAAPTFTVIPCWCSTASNLALASIADTPFGCLIEHEYIMSFALLSCFCISVLTSQGEEGRAECWIQKLSPPLTGLVRGQA